MTLPILLLLQRVLRAQQMTVGDPEFPATAQLVLAALVELDAAIAALLPDVPAP